MYCSEDCYAAVIEATDDMEIAKRLLSVMESGETDTVQPGFLSHEAYINCCVRNEAWMDVLSTYTQLEQNGINPSTGSDFYKLLALYKTGGQSDAIQFLASIVAMERTIDMRTTMLSLRILYPEVLLDIPTTDTLDTDIEQLRRYLLEQSKRMISIEEEPRKVQCYRLVRSLQIANVERSRLATGGLTEGVLEQRRVSAWKEVMQCLLTYDEISKK
jgi:hypothetical protein